MTAEGSEQQTADTPEVAPRRGFWRRYRWPLLVLLGLVYLAPLGVARYLVTRGVTLHSPEGGAFQIRCEEASLGWFSPVKFEDVRIEDAAGRSLLEVPRVVSQRSLASLAVNRTRPGRFFIEHPTLNVTVRDDGSNLEDFLRTFDRGDAQRRSLSIGARITRGLVSFRDAAGQPLIQVDAIDCKGMQQQGTDLEIDIELSAHIVHQDQRQPVETAIHWRGPAGNLPFLSGVGTAAVKFAPLPVAAIRPLLARLAPEIAIESGTLSGRLLIESDFRDQQMLKATGELVTQNVQGERYTAGGEPAPFAWSNEPLQFNIKGEFDPDADRLEVVECGVQSTPLSVTATGTITQPSTDCLLDLAGNLQYDVTPLVQSLAGSLSEHVQLEGLQAKQFRVSGPLARRDKGQSQWDPTQLTVSTLIRWDRASVFGVLSEQATLAADFSKGLLQISPREVPVSGGRYHTVATMELTGDDPAAWIATGPALEDVELSAEMCQLWLKFVSPVVADATRASGRFSMDLEEGRFPLRDPAVGQIRGSLDIHSGQVRPGPFADQIIGIISSIKTLIDRKPGGLATDRLQITVPEQQIPFTMANGRVTHERMQFLVAGAVVQTSGSVGVDESLDLLLEVPLDTSWFSNELLSAALGGEVIRVPIRGTFERPQFQLQALRELTRRLAARATGSLLQKLLD